MPMSDFDATVHCNFRRWSFNKLRKTAGNLVRGPAEMNRCWADFGTNS